MDFSCLAPLSLSLTGDLSAVLNKGQTVETSDPIIGDALLQVTRFSCSSPDYARMVQVEVEAQGLFRFAFNPFSDRDELRLQRFLRGGTLIFVRVKPGNVNIGSLPNLAGNDFRVDLLG
ncbi:MAG TPA: hypothetical protein VFT46_07155 [Holophagaceae bacterium]|nr:hypothetical protein [Holophagaceae bacterium]